MVRATGSLELVCSQEGCEPDLSREQRLGRTRVGCGRFDLASMAHGSGPPEQADDIGLAGPATAAIAAPRCHNSQA